MRRCNFCKGKESIPAVFGNKGGVFYMTDFVLNFLSASGEGSMSIKYCPFCKKRLSKLK